MRKLKNPLMVYIGFALFFAAGSFCLFLGFKSLVGISGYAKTTATIISLRTYESDDGDLLGVPTYEYYVDGERYENERSYGQSLGICPMVGDTITIRYNKKDPSVVRDDSISTIMFFVFGLIFTGVGGTMFVLSAMGKIHWTSSRRSYRRNYGKRKRSVKRTDREYDNPDIYASDNAETEAEAEAKKYSHWTSEYSGSSDEPENDPFN